MSKRVVVLTDQPFTAASVSSALETGFDVVSVEFGEVSASSISEIAPSLVIIDTPEGEFDVVSLHKGLKQDEITADVPVVFLQGSFEPEDDEISQLGEITRLSKPFTSEEIKELTAELLKKAESKPPGVTSEEGRVPELEVSEEALDAALEEALSELRSEEAVRDDVVALSDDKESMEELGAAHEDDEGVSSDELEGLVGAAESDEEPERTSEEVVQVTEQTSVKAESEVSLDKEIDAIVDEVMQKVSEELKVSLKKAVSESLSKMTRSAVQNLLPKLSERLVQEMFTSDKQKS